MAQPLRMRLRFCGTGEMRLDASTAPLPRRLIPRPAHALRVLVVLFLAFVLSGCQVAKSAFADVADNVGANFAAAATTLQYLHEGKLTRQYARATFFNYASLTSGADATMEHAAGAPDLATLDRLLRLYQPAAQALTNPCLDNSCNWRGQISALEKASGAFRQAAKA